jgi:hypothetical protein
MSTDVFLTRVRGVGPWCIEFDDFEIITTRRADRAQLIAAAPELLATAEALEEHIKRGAPQPEGHALRRRLQAAIARAKGSST